ncbi:n-acetylglutamate synthase [Fulvitalea axinellae]
MATEINFDGKVFRSLSNTDNGEVSGETLFRYSQKGDLVWAEYSGGGILKGHLIAKTDKQGRLDMRYQHVNDNGEIRTGVCNSTPDIMPDGSVKLQEKWRWTCGDHSEGESVLVEVPASG